MENKAPAFLFEAVIQQGMWHLMLIFPDLPVSPGLWKERNAVQCEGTTRGPKGETPGGCDRSAGTKESPGVCPAHVSRAIALAEGRA